MCNHSPIHSYRPYTGCRRRTSWPCPRTCRPRTRRRRCRRLRRHRPFRAIAWRRGHTRRSWRRTCPRCTSSRRRRPCPSPPYTCQPGTRRGCKRCRPGHSLRRRSSRIGSPASGRTNRQCTGCRHRSRLPFRTSTCRPCTRRPGCTRCRRSCRACRQPRLSGRTGRSWHRIPAGHTVRPGSRRTSRRLQAPVRRSPEVWTCRRTACPRTGRRSDSQRRTCSRSRCQWSGTGRRCISRSCTGCRRRTSRPRRSDRRSRRPCRCRYRWPAGARRIRRRSRRRTRCPGTCRSVRQPSRTRRESTVSSKRWPRSPLCTRMHPRRAGRRQPPFLPRSTRCRSGSQAGRSLRQRNCARKIAPATLQVCQSRRRSERPCIRCWRCTDRTRISAKGRRRRPWMARRWRRRRWLARPGRRRPCLAPCSRRRPCLARRLHLHLCLAEQRRRHPCSAGCQPPSSALRFHRCDRH